LSSVFFPASPVCSFSLTGRLSGLAYLSSPPFSASPRTHLSYFPPIFFFLRLFSSIFVLRVGSVFLPSTLSVKLVAPPLASESPKIHELRNRQFVSNPPSPPPSPTLFKLRKIIHRDFLASAFTAVTLIFRLEPVVFTSRRRERHWQVLHSS